MKCITARQTSSNHAPAMFSTNFNKYILKIQDDYDFIKKFAKRRNGICGVQMDDLTDLPYQTLKHDIPDLFKKGEFEKAMHLILKHYGKNVTFGGVVLFRYVRNRILMIRVKKAKNNHKLCFLLWIKEQYERINKTEEKFLYSPPDAKLLQAGIRELDILEDYNLIDTLAQGDILKWKKIRKMPYSEVFNKQLKNTIEGRINKRLVEINKTK